MNYSVIRKFDVANWLGCRTSIFFSCCYWHCKGCFNKELWDKNSGKPFDREAEDKLFEYLSDPHIKGLSVLGGEPLEQGQELVNLLIKVRVTFPHKDIALWTGYYIDGRDELNETQKTILSLCDVVIDGRFIEELKDPSLYFRGSSNQTIWERDKETKQLIRSELNDK